MTDQEFVAEARRVLGLMLTSKRYTVTTKLLMPFDQAELSRLMDTCEELVRLAYSAQEFHRLQQRQLGPVTPGRRAA